MSFQANAYQGFQQAIVDTAFQPGAFQSDAFQMLDTAPVVSGGGPTLAYLGRLPDPDEFVDDALLLLL